MKTRVTKTHRTIIETAARLACSRDAPEMRDEVVEQFITFLRRVVKNEAIEGEPLEWASIKLRVFLKQR